jgi:hypothetical protein
MQVKFDLSDWQNRKGRLDPLMAEAVRAGLVPQDGAARLGEFLLGRGVDVVAPPSIPAGTPPTGPSGLDTPRDSEPASAVEESEAPRFVRGFHDILITIGIIVGLVGLGGLASVYAVIPAAIVLAEILVRRQRLALPAVTLTVAVALAVFMGTLPVLDDFDAAYGDWIPAGLLLLVTLAGLLLYWRYRIPLALAGTLVGLYAALSAGLFALIRLVTGSQDFFRTHPSGVVFLLGLFAVLTFGTALRFDMADRLRTTRRSDVAFWMHLAAAPAILYTIMAQIYFGFQQDWLAADTTVWQAAAIVGAVMLLMLIGIVLDRRAFVTSGLISFGYAFKVLMTEGGLARLEASADTLLFVTLLAIGVVVLSLGIGWQPLRRVILRVLPPALQALVPPAR